jgi:hypothetical protein
MKRIFLSGLILVFSIINVLAQGGQRNWQEQYRELESQRIAFLTKELSLTPEEAQVFWPVYNEYNQKRNRMMIQHRRQRNESGDLNQLNERELKILAELDVKSMEEMAKLRRDYHEKFMQILPARKVVLLYDAERDFNRRLMQEHRGGGRRPGR